jgi:O-antigen/teichoic acid export membrane protein
MASTEPSGSVEREFKHVAAYSGLGWLQAQSDRVAVGAAAGPSILGVYSLAWSVARSIGDGLALSTANVLRASIATVSSLEAVRSTSTALLGRALVLSTAIAAGISTVAILILEPLLPRAWDEALDIVPVLALSTIPTAIAWSLTVVLIQTGRVRMAVPIKTLGVLAAAPIAVAAMSSLTLAAWFAAGRELALMLMLAASGRDATPWRVVRLASLVCVAFAALIIIGSAMR